MKHKKLIIPLAIVLIAALAIGLTLAYFTDTKEVTNTFTMGDLEIDLTEDWDPDDGEDMVPGDTVVKEPVITAVKNDSYVRVILTLVDKDATPTAGVYPPITNTTRINKIMSTLFYDGTGTTIAAGTKYSAVTDWAAWAVAGSGIDTPYNKTDFELASSGGGVFVFYYKGGAAPNPYIFTEGTAATLFTHVVIPTEWTQTDLRLLGKYDINIRAEAIQAAGFVSHVDAFAALP